MILHLSHMGLTDGLTFILSSQLVLVSPNDTTFGQIVGADFHFYRIAFNDLDALDAHLPGRVGDDLRAALFQFDSVRLVRVEISPYDLTKGRIVWRDKN